MALRKAEHTVQEFALIRALRRRFTRRAPLLVRGIGDDAAVIAASPQTWWHLTTDLLAEGVHFDLRTASSESVGYRAAVANLSDIAAMGAVPRFLLTAIAVPKIFKPVLVHQLYRGLMKACDRYGVRLVGGDTSASKAGLFLGITLVGTTRADRALFRLGARAGDRIYVTGTLGDSRAGLQILTQDRTTTAARRASSRLSSSHRRFLVNRHLRPTARLAEGQWLNRAGLASSAIDLSDGLSGDLRHICEESGVGAELELDKIPISQACRAYADLRGLQASHLALSGGEDYELLFTVPSNLQSTVERNARGRNYRITCIGTIRSKRFGIQMTTSDGTRRPIPMISYEHFR